MYGKYRVNHSTSVIVQYFFTHHALNLGSAFNLSTVLFWSMGLKPGLGTPPSYMKSQFLALSVQMVQSSGVLPNIVVGKATKP